MKMSRNMDLFPERGWYQYKERGDVEVITGPYITSAAAMGIYGDGGVKPPLLVSVFTKYHLRRPKNSQPNPLGHLPPMQEIE